MAEAVRFELTIELPLCLLSRQVPSATRPRFRDSYFTGTFEPMALNGLSGLGLG